MSDELVALIVIGPFFSFVVYYLWLDYLKMLKLRLATDAQVTQAILQCGSVRQKILALNAPLSLRALEKITYDCLQEEENATALRAQKNAATNFQSETLTNEDDK